MNTATDEAEAPIEGAISTNDGDQEGIFIWNISYFQILLYIVITASSWKFVRSFIHFRCTEGGMLFWSFYESLSEIYTTSLKKMWSFIYSIHDSELDFKFHILNDFFTFLLAFSTLFFFFHPVHSIYKKKHNLIGDGFIFLIMHIHSSRVNQCFCIQFDREISYNQGFEQFEKRTEKRGNVRLGLEKSVYLSVKCTCAFIFLKIITFSIHVHNTAKKTFVCVYFHDHHLLFLLCCWQVVDHLHLPFIVIIYSLPYRWNTFVWNSIHIYCLIACPLNILNVHVYVQCVIACIYAYLQPFIHVYQ